MSVVDEIKQRLDIVDVIGDYVSLKKAGANYKGLCPFHTEKTPSFVVFPDTQTWHCFGACSTGGDIFSFIMRYERIDFSEALRLLAERAGLSLQPESPLTRERRDALERLRAINRLAAEWYHAMLNSPEGAAAHAYLMRRGITEESIEAFQLGFAPNEWHRLEQYLRREGVSQEEALQAGLLASNESGNVYDRFRGRLIFPIRDVSGHVIGFGGRVLDDTLPKYINSPQTPLFDKGSVLYGLDLARPAIRETNTAIIVEGYMDVIMAHQCGVRNVIACLGTALSEAHIDVLKHVTRTLVLALDPDAAGLQAALRGAQTAREALPHEVVPIPDARGLIHYEERLDAEIRILVLPEGLDPDELILHDRERWDRLVSEALPVVDFVFWLAQQEVDVSTARGKREAADRLLPVIASLGNPVERAHYIQRLARWIRVDERDLLLQLDRLREDKRSRDRFTSSSARSTSRQPPRLPTQVESGLRLEEHCLMLMLENPAFAGEVINILNLGEEVFDDTRHREIFCALRELVSSEDVVSQLLERLDTESARQVESLRSRYQGSPPLTPEMLREDLLKSSARLKRRHLLWRIGALRFVQQDAQEQGLAEQARALAQEIKRLTEECRQVERQYFAATLMGRRNTDGIWRNG